jgi:hypothetical protein
VWERPVLFYCLADRIGPARLAVLRALAPARAGVVFWLVGARFRPRESLLQLGWSAWGRHWVWRWE